MVAFKNVSVVGGTLADIIMRSLPQQGSVEVQRDSAGKEHAWHSHQTDETIIVLQGGLRFYWENGEKSCGAGDVISLPKGERHGSVALDKGAIYLVAFNDLAL